jgi:hypothetical protein
MSSDSIDADATIVTIETGFMVTTREPADHNQYRG